MCGEISTYCGMKPDILRREFEELELSTLWRTKLLLSSSLSHRPSMDPSRAPFDDPESDVDNSKFKSGLCTLPYLLKENLLEEGGGVMVPEPFGKGLGCCPLIPLHDSPISPRTVLFSNLTGLSRS